MDAFLPRAAALRAAWLALLGTAAFGGTAGAVELPPAIGELRRVAVAPGETLVDLAYTHRLGYGAIARLNPDVSVWIPEPGTQVVLPTRAILPEAPAEGIVVNLPEQRLYDFGAGAFPDVYAVAIGDAVDPTPIGSFRLGTMQRYPHWRVPEKIRAKRPELPPVVRPGPGNPLGSRWMTLGASSYGIHGTDTPYSIGRLATHGCVRLYDDEARRLYERVRPGTPVRILYQSVKLGLERGTLLLEVHPDPYGREPDRAAALAERLAALGPRGRVDAALVARELEAERGVPVPIGVLEAPGPDITPLAAG